jgi:hypothetical protein
MKLSLTTLRQRTMAALIGKLFVLRRTSIKPTSGCRQRYGEQDAMRQHLGGQDHIR